MFNLLIYKKIYITIIWNSKEIYTMHSKQVHNVYRFMYHYICKLRINFISQYFPPSWEIWVFPAFLPTLFWLHYLKITTSMTKREIWKWADLISIDWIDINFTWKKCVKIIYCLVTISYKYVWITLLYTNFQALFWQCQWRDNIIINFF